MEAMIHHTEVWLLTERMLLSNICCWANTSCFDAIAHLRPSRPRLLTRLLRAIYAVYIVHICRHLTAFRLKKRFQTYTVYMKQELPPVCQSAFPHIQCSHCLAYLAFGMVIL